MACESERGDQRFANFHAVTEFYMNFCIQRQVEARARAELNQADQFTASDGVAGLSPDVDAPGDESCDEPNGQFASGELGGLKSEERVLVEITAIGFCAAQE